MFGLGIGEILIILAFALIFIGPKKLPELAKSLGKSLREFQHAKDELLNNMDVNNHPPNNPPQHFEDEDHIEAEVTGVSETDLESEDLASTEVVDEDNQESKETEDETKKS